MYPANYQPPTGLRPQARATGGGPGRKPGCVFLRPEQNIPDVFSTKFKPIMPDAGSMAVGQEDTRLEPLKHLIFTKYFSTKISVLLGFFLSKC